MNKTVIVGMSGGVDSSVAAYLLKQQGYDVIGVTMRLWQEEGQTLEGSCCSVSAVEDARRVATAIGIPHYVMNFEKEFQQYVVDYFAEEYLAGHTPNPCIACNRYVKWEALLNKGLALGADYIATGHYAKVGQLPNGRYSIFSSVTATKDQTYALYNLTQDQLSHTLMPVGDYHKDEIRKIAAEIDLMVSSKKDSQEICFIPDNDYAGFLNRYEGERMPGPGNFVKEDGTVLGTHKGITNYTIGQRKGLDLAMGHPVFVTEIRPETNEVVIGESEDLFTDTLYCNKINLMAVDHLEQPVRLIGKIRYGHKGSPCTVTKVDEDVLEVKFDENQRAITPGQAVVLYENDHIFGGGTIIGTHFYSNSNILIHKTP